MAEPAPAAEAARSTITPVPGQDAWEIHDYDEESDSTRTFRYVLQNKINPLVRSTIDTTEEGRQFIYRYRLSNGKQAEQNIDYFWICCVPLQVFDIPENEPFPKKTGDTDTDKAAMKEWYKRMRADAKFIVDAGDRYLRAPATWDSNLKQSDGSAGYGWQPRTDIEQVYGIPADTWAEGYAFPRPELPGVRFATLQGFSGIDQFPGSYNIDTDDPKLKEEIAAIKRSDGRWLPVLAPVFSIADPFDASAFTTQLWNEIENKWYREDDYSLSLVAPEVFTQLEHEFERLLTALEASNTSAANAAIARMLTSVAQWTAPDSVTPENAAQELATNDTVPLATTRAPVTDPDSADAATHNIHRIAARALVFNLAYLQERLNPPTIDEAPPNSITAIPGQDAWQILEFDEGSDSVKTYRYDLQNKISPLMRSTIDTDEDGQQFVYRYRLSNRKQAQTSIEYFWMCCAAMPELEDFNKETADDAADEATVAEEKKRKDDAYDDLMKRVFQYPDTWDYFLRDAGDSVGINWSRRSDTEPIIGLPPDSLAEGFTIVRPALPGVILTSFWGRGIAPEWFPGYFYGGDESIPLQAQISAINRMELQLIPVLLPIFPIGEPFDTVAFIRQFWDDINTNWDRNWHDYARSLLAPAVVTELKHEFEILLTALETNNTATAHAAIARMLASIAQWTAPDSITPENAAHDLEASDTDTLPRTRAPVTDPDSPDAATHSIHRIAARALVFNLNYLQKHLGSDK